MPTLLSAFTAHWNFFDKACLNWYKDFDRFDIEANKGLEFWGEKISIFYEFNFGSYPYYRNYDENEPVNGGHPQLCNLTAHLEVVKLNITKRIKDENFAGLAVIDFEHWRPLFDENGYQKMQAILEEALRIANMFSPPLPIYAYTKIEYDSRTKIGNFYNAEDLCSTTKQPADLGVDGIIFWGSSNNIKQRCPFIEKEMDGTVGP
ncbi:hypothetical protein RB195_020732 [Necator americanus]|uniref:Hyaluronidase n=1 Tax=Necator americanus TaxID=51031 RepID=A0ABR1CL33_NECAM